MASNRIGRINEEIQRELSSLLRTVKDPRLQSGLFTITNVDTTGDLRYTKVYISALDKSQEKEMMKGLRSAAGYLRRELGALCEKAGKELYLPALPLCGDNAAMIASQGYYEYLAGNRAGSDLNASPNMPIDFPAGQP